MIQSSPSLDTSSANHNNNCPAPGLPGREVIGKTVFKFADRSLFKEGADRPLPPAPTLAAMEQLVAIIHSLRSTALAANEPPTDSWNPEVSLTPATLLPYVSEETYEVLDALETPAAGNPTAAAKGDGEKGQPGIDPVSDLSPWFVTVETMVPYLLWAVARSSYPVMHLIEGIYAQHYQFNQTWVSGMLRLVVMLEANTPTLGWCVDLATGCLPGNLLDDEDWLQSDEPILPATQANQSASMPTLLDLDRPSGSMGQVRSLLEEFGQSIQEEMPALQPLLEGLLVDLLQPGQPWQPGQLQLKIGVEFIPQPPDAIAHHPSQAFSTLVAADLVEAELLEDDTPAQRSQSKNASRVENPSPVMRVSVVELPRQIPSPTILIRLADQGIPEHRSQTILQQELARSIAHLQATPINGNTDQGLLPIVQEAWRAIDRANYRINSTIDLGQPTLLIDELMPKMLWQITRSSYEITQLIGGVEVTALQPGLDWESGTLRLIVALQIQATAIQSTIDLITGRHLTPETTLLDPTTLCQLCLRSSLGEHLTSTFSWQSPVQAETVISHLQQQIRTTAPEVGQFMDVTPIEWLETDREWQPGTLKLSLNLELIPNQWRLP